LKYFGDYFGDVGWIFEEIDSSWLRFKLVSYEYHDIE
jgi:hypothetical protein